MTPAQARLRAGVVEVLQANGPQSRAELARRFQVSRSTMSSLISALQADGLTEEAGDAGARSRAGRPGALVALRAPKGYFVAIDFGRIVIRAAISDANYRILEQTSSDFDIDSPAEAALDLAAALVEKVVADSGVDGREIKGVGIGVPGPVDASTGQLHAGSILARWVGTDVASGLARRLGLPVYMDNDANLGALAESVYGAAREVPVALYVLLSIGVGLGIVINGQVFRGSTGIAGELGHIVVDEHGAVCRCGSRGCLEAIVSVNALSKALSVSHGNISSDEMLRLAVAGDVGAGRIVRDAGALVGRYVGHLCSFFNPALVIVGGELMRAEEILLQPLEDAMRRFSIARATENVRVVPAALGEQAELIGTLLFTGEKVRAAELRRETVPTDLSDMKGRAA